MVDVGKKAVTERRAVARGRVRVSPELHRAIAEQTLGKGNLLQVVELAGIQAAKRTSQLIPLCHGIPLDVARVDARLADGAVELRAEVETTAKTGVEMEALTAVAVAALTVIDMGKSVDRAMVIEGIRLVEKSGGASGDFALPDAPDREPSP